jgi:hypothetical protein
MHYHPWIITPSTSPRLGFLRKRFGEAAHVLFEVALVAEELDVSAVDLDAALLALGDVLFAAERGEAPVLRHNDFLAARELHNVNQAIRQVKTMAYLVLGSPEGLNSGGAGNILCSDREDDLTDVHTSDTAVRLAERATHTSLQSIGTGAWQHLIDTDDMVRVGADTEVEGFLSSSLDHVLVGANTGGFKGLRGHLFVLVGDQVDAEGELVNVGTLAAKVEDADFGVGYTTVEARLGVLKPGVSLRSRSFLSLPAWTYRLVLAVPVATGGTSGHRVGCCIWFQINELQLWVRFRDTDDRECKWQRARILRIEWGNQ